MRIYNGYPVLNVQYKSRMDREDTSVYVRVHRCIGLKVTSYQQYLIDENNTVGARQLYK